jgi:hypothetical protein
MSASPNQLHSHAKNRPVILITIALLMVAVISYLIFSKPSKERLIKNLNSQLREENFVQLYEQADEAVHSIVTKEQFVQRMKIAVSKLKAIDENLNFQRDRVEESLFDGDERLVTAVQKLGKDGKSVSVHFMWPTDTRKFFDLSIYSTQGASEEQRPAGDSNRLHITY